MRRLSLAVMAFFLMIAPARAETVTLVGDEWCPYICGSDPTHPGLLIEIAHKALEKDGVTIEYKTMPWARALKDTRAGKYTAVLGALHDAAPDLIFPEMAQAQSVVTFYVRKGSEWRFSVLEDLMRVSLGTIADYSYNPALDDYITRNRNDIRRIQQVAGQRALDSNVKKLIMGRIDATVETAAVMDYYLADQNLRKQIVPAGRMESTQDLFIAFSPKDPSAKKYADLVNAETQRLVISGEMNALWARYNLSPGAP